MQVYRTPCGLSYIKIVFFKYLFHLRGVPVFQFGKRGAHYAAAKPQQFRRLFNGDGVNFAEHYVDERKEFFLQFGSLAVFARKIKAMGAYVLGVKRTLSDKPPYCDELYTSEHLEDLVPRADIIALSLPGNKSTEHIFDKKMLSLTKKGSVLLNVGRGSAVDTTALCELLKAGHFEGVGLDVTEPEPLPSDHPLWDIPNAIITPHISGYFHLPKTLERIIDIALENLSRFNNGEELKNQVDYTTGYRKN